MDLIWVMFGFFTFITVVFLVFAFAFPEWVGITGKQAKKIQEHQKNDDSKTEDIL